MRAIQHRYRDPLDQIWLMTARRMGLVVTRSQEVYASTNGAGTLALGKTESLDADDSLAQMIFHEICHWLVQGKDALALPDWGLDNTGERDTAREHACLRLQAVLAAEHGLRRFFAPTTDHRAFWDELGKDPLVPRHEPSVVLAILALGRVDTPPFAPHLRQALEATSSLARLVSGFADTEDAGDLPALWQGTEPPLPRHPAGFAMHMDSHAERTCERCAWHYRSGRDQGTSRCRQAGRRVSPGWPACERWEPALDCQACGACCRDAYDSVTVSRRDPVVKRHPELVVDRGSYVEIARLPLAPDRRCAALCGGSVDADGGLEPYWCAIYEDRPRPCREFERGGAHCLTARRRVGLSR